MRAYFLLLLLLLSGRAACGQATTTLAGRSLNWLDSVQRLPLPRQVAAVRARAWRDMLPRTWQPAVCRGLLSAAAQRQLAAAPVAPAPPRPTGFPLLYVLNGQPYGGSAASIRQFEQALATTRHIRQVTLLREASATTIYGSRAANGVVLLSSKKE